ncbi:MAG: hypothetical protein ACYC5S_09165 [Thiobacillus sp.]
MRCLLLVRFVSSCCLLLGAAALFLARGGAPSKLAPIVDEVSAKSAFVIILAALSLLLSERDARKTRGRSRRSAICAGYIATR